jgi:hypothetical protein
MPVVALINIFALQVVQVNLDKHFLITHSVLIAKIQPIFIFVQFVALIVTTFII